mmetsp:Transcript_43546/g.105112  ORF Transcript_43546/g.105112 Transcript_43546/m.105112 type:complete len:202 (+) Transcript_43546:144-749(+)
MLPLLEELAVSTSNGNIMPYEAYFHSLLQSSGASRLELVRDDAILGSDPGPLEDANFLFDPSYAAAPKVDSGLPSRPDRKPSAENLLLLSSPSTPDDLRVARDSCCDHPSECPSPSCSSSGTHFRTGRKKGMRSWCWTSERASREALNSFLEDATPAERDMFPPSSPRGKGLPAPRNANNRRKHCRWSASSVPNTVGKTGR